MCNRCLKQYEDQTIDQFRHRWKNYKDNPKKFERGKHCMQKDTCMSTLNYQVTHGF